VPANFVGGGPWAGRAWSPDLPNDSMLMLYFFAAFIDAPGWHFDSSSATASDGGAGYVNGGIEGGTVGGAGACGVVWYGEVYCGVIV